MTPDLLSQIPFLSDAAQGGAFAVVYGIVSRMVVVPAINQLGTKIDGLTAQIQGFMAALGTHETPHKSTAPLKVVKSAEDAAS